MTLEEHLAKKTANQGDCLIWTGPLNIGGYGYLQIGGVNGRKALAHRLVWEAANGPIPDGWFVCHRCDNRRCVRLDHLFLGTAADNQKDMSLKGRSRRGELATGARLTADTVRAIRQQYAEGKASQSKIARRFGITQGNVHCIVTRKSWKHIE
jgi:hypothetical protein